MTITGPGVAIITGGVSGIGEELSRELIRKGWKVAAFDIEPQSGLGAKLTKELGADFIFLPCDVSKYNELADAFSQVFKKWGQINAFCSNAGIIDKSSVLVFKYRGKTEVPPEPDLTTTDVCFKATVYGTQLSIHFMRQNPIPGGFIIATSSIVSIHPNSSFPEYCGAKAAINGFILACAPVLKHRENITANAVCPGVVPTQFIDQEMRDTFQDNLTPKATIVSGYLKCLEDRSLNGELIEASRDRLLIMEKPQYADGEYTKRTCTLYDPTFISVHGEPSKMAGVLNSKG